MDIITTPFELRTSVPHERRISLPNIRHLGNVALIAGLSVLASLTLYAAPKLTAAELKHAVPATKVSPVPNRTEATTHYVQNSIYGPKPTGIRQLLGVYAVQKVDQGGGVVTYRYIVEPAFDDNAGEHALGGDPGIQDGVADMAPGEYILCPDPTGTPREVFGPLGMNYVTGRFASNTARLGATGDVDQLPWPCTTTVDSHGYPNSAPQTA